MFGKTKFYFTTIVLLTMFLSFIVDLPPKKWTHGKEIYALSCSYFSGDTYPNWECNLFRL
jgi:hypothetical protein